MTDLSADTILAVFLIFCRVGGCFLMMPGFSSNRVPMNIRLFIALTASLALSPLILGNLQLNLRGQSPLAVLWWITSETLTGILIGFLGRIYFMALVFQHLLQRIANTALIVNNQYLCQLIPEL